MKRIFKNGLFLFIAMFLFVSGIKAEWKGEMDPTSAKITVGETVKVTAKQTGDERIKTIPSYVSSDESVATVDSEGNVKGIKMGVAVVTGKFGNVVAGTTTITVVSGDNEWKGEMTPVRLYLKVGETGKVQAKQVSSLVVNTIPSYVSSDESVAKVDRQGNVTAVKAGTATITGKFGNLVAGTTTVIVGATPTPGASDEWTGEMVPTVATINVGDTVKVLAKQTSSLVVNTIPSYTSSDESIATVDREGNVKGISAGTVTITGKFGNLVAGTTTVTVTTSKGRTDEWTGEMNPTSATVFVGETVKVQARQTSSLVVNTIPSYTSSNSKVATVDREGNVKGISEGTATITGKFGKLVAGTTVITVKAKDDNKWTGEMTPTNASIFVGETVRVQAKQTGTLRVNTVPTYISSDSKIATVDSEGVVTGLKSGVVTITGKFGSMVAGTTIISVQSKTEESKWTGEMVPKSLVIFVGDNATVSAKQTSSLVVNTIPSYTSSDTAIVTVDRNGVITGVSAGTAEITGKFGNLVAGTTIVTVKDLSETSKWEGTIEANQKTIGVGDSTAVVVNQTGDIVVDTIVTYTSSDENVATVDSEGNVTGVSAGVATITAKYGDNLVAGSTTITVEGTSSEEVKKESNNLVIYICGALLVIVSGVYIFLTNKK